MRVFRYRIPLTAPLKLKGRTYHEREGILLEREGEWAEASPLPGFSKESIDDVILALEDKKPNPPALEFAMNELGRPFVAPVSVPWNFLLVGGKEKVLADASACQSVDSQTAKLKVGQNSLREDIQLVRDVREQLDSEIALRLDANRAWSLDEASEFVESLVDLEWEFIEEPLRNPNLLEDLYARTGVRYALDETLVDYESIVAWPNATALIIKPSILGGRDKVTELSQFGKPLIFSSAFESGIGVGRIVQLANEFSPGIPAGLDTLSWLADDLLVESARKSAGQFVIRNKPQVKEELLEQIV